MTVRYDTFVLNDSIARPANTTQYAAGDVISEVTTNDHYSFGANREGPITGTINTARIHINSNPGTKPDLELWLFSQDIVEVADNGVFAPTDAEMLTRIGVIKFPVADWIVGLSGADAAGNIGQEVVPSIVIPERPLVIYGQLVVRNAYTPISSEQFDVDLTFTKERN